jgi:hypothetical protein
MEKFFAFKKPGICKYLLTITSNMNLSGFSSDNVVEIRWLVRLKEIIENGYVFELITTDHTMVKSDNSGYIEIHKLVQQMNKALHEIVFTVDKQGVLLKINNLDQIRARWNSVKSEVLEYNKSNTSLVDLFKIQDEIFEKQESLEDMVRAMEFFDIYFNEIYGRDFFSRTKRNIHNIFRSGEIPFILKYDNNKINDHFSEVTLEGIPNILSETHIKDLYSGFPFVDIDNVKPIYTYKGHYVIDETNGFIENCEINFSEYVNDKLSSEIHYKLKKYE